GRSDQFLGSLPTIFIEGEFVFAMLTCEHFVECLLEPLASFGFRPERFVIINDAIGISSGLTGVTDDLTGHFSVRISAHVDRAYNHALWRIIFDLFVLQLAEILLD